MARPHRDRFDDVDESAVRVGAHRTRRRAAHRWAVFGIAALAAAVLASAGVVVLGIWDPQYAVSLPGSSSTAPTSVRTDRVVAPTTRPSGLSTAAATVNLLEASEPKSVIAGVESKLKSAGWQVGAAAPLSGGAPDVTTVYYSPTTMEGYALGIVKTLGYGTAVLSDEYSSSGLTIVLGSDAG